MGIKSTLRAIYHGIFPRQIQLTTKQKNLLTAMYPSICWQEVSFYKDLPWFMLNSFAIATVLPAQWSGKQLKVYFQSYQEDNFKNLCTLVHEAYHVLQYQELHRHAKGLEWGFFRTFMWHYIGGYFALLWYYLRKRYSFKEASYNAYRYHPIEIDAYQQEAAFAKEEWNYKQFSDQTAFIQKHYSLKCTKSGYQQQRPPYWASAIGVIFCLLINIIRPITEFCLLISLFPIIYIIGKER